MRNKLANRIVEFHEIINETASMLVGMFNSIKLGKIDSYKLDDLKTSLANWDSILSEEKNARTLIDSAKESVQKTISSLEKQMRFQLNGIQIKKIQDNIYRTLIVIDRLNKSLVQKTASLISKRFLFAEEYSILPVDPLSSYLAHPCDFCEQITKDIGEDNLCVECRAENSDQPKS